MYAANTAHIALPAMLGKFFLYNYLDRKRSLVAVFLVCAASCFTQAALRWIVLEGVVHAALATLSLGCTFVAQNMALTFIPECFPTECRNSAVGICMGWGRIGAVFATYIARLDDLVWPPLPMVVFGAANVMAAVVVPLIPKRVSSGLEDRLPDSPLETSEDATTNGATEMREMAEE